MSEAVLAERGDNLLGDLYIGSINLLECREGGVGELGAKDGASVARRIPIREGD